MSVTPKNPYQILNSKAVVNPKKKDLALNWKGNVVTINIHNNTANRTVYDKTGKLTKYTNAHTHNIITSKIRIKFNKTVNNSKINELINEYYNKLNISDEDLVFDLMELDKNAKIDIKNYTKEIPNFGESKGRIMANHCQNDFRIFVKMLDKEIARTNTQLKLAQKNYKNEHNKEAKEVIIEKKAEINKLKMQYRDDIVLCKSILVKQNNAKSEIKLYQKQLKTLIKHDAYDGIKDHYTRVAYQFKACGLDINICARIYLHSNRNISISYLPKINNLNNKYVIHATQNTNYKNDLLIFQKIATILKNKNQKLIDKYSTNPWCDSPNGNQVNLNNVKILKDLLSFIKRQLSLIENKNGKGKYFYNNYDNNYHDKFKKLRTSSINKNYEYMVNCIAKCGINIYETKEGRKLGYNPAFLSKPINNAPIGQKNKNPADTTPLNMTHIHDDMQLLSYYATRIEKELKYSLNVNNDEYFHKLLPFMNALNENNVNNDSNVNHDDEEIIHKKNTNENLNIWKNSIALIQTELRILQNINKQIDDLGYDRNNYQKEKRYGMIHDAYVNIAKGFESIGIKIYEWQQAKPKYDPFSSVRPNDFPFEEKNDLKHIVHNSSDLMDEKHLEEKQNRLLFKDISNNYIEEEEEEKKSEL
jgi:hypothetical protein